MIPEESDAGEVREAYDFLSQRLGVRRPPKVALRTSLALGLTVMGVAGFSVFSTGLPLDPAHAAAVAFGVAVAAVLVAVPGYLDFLWRVRQMRPTHPDVEDYLNRFAADLNETRAAVLQLEEDLAGLGAGNGEAGLDEILSRMRLEIDWLSARGAGNGLVSGEDYRELEVPEGGFLGRALGSTGATPAISRMVERSRGGSGSLREPGEPAADAAD